MCKIWWVLPKRGATVCVFKAHWHNSKNEKTNTVASSTTMAPPSPTYYQPQSNVFDLDFSLLRRRHHKWCRHHVCNSISQTSIVLVLLICSKLYTMPSTIKVLYISSTFWLLLFFSSCDRKNCLQSWANSQNDNYFHLKRQPRNILSENSCHFVNLLSLRNMSCTVVCL